MRVNEEMEIHPRPRLSLKIGYYLTDVSGRELGQYAAGARLAPAR